MTKDEQEKRNGYVIASATMAVWLGRESETRDILEYAFGLFHFTIKPQLIQECEGLYEEMVQDEEKDVRENEEEDEQSGSLHSDMEVDNEEEDKPSPADDSGEPLSAS